MRSTEYFELFRGVFACNLTLLINKKKYCTFDFNIVYGSEDLCERWKLSGVTALYTLLVHYALLQQLQCKALSKTALKFT